MRSFIALLCLAALTACTDPSPQPKPIGVDRDVLGAASVQIGATLAVDNRHTLHAGAASGSVVSTNPTGRLVAVIAD